MKQIVVEVTQEDLQTGIKACQTQNVLPSGICMVAQALKRQLNLVKSPRAYVQFCYLLEEGEEAESKYLYSRHGTELVNEFDFLREAAENMPEFNARYDALAKQLPTTFQLTRVAE